MSDSTTLREFRRTLETADLDEHAETLEHAVTTALGQVAAARAGGKTLRGPAAALAASATTLSASKLAASEFERMKEFLVRLYDGTSSRHSFLDPNGHVFDCIPFEQLPTVRAARKANIPIDRQAPPPPKLDHPKESELHPWTAAPRFTGIVGPLRRGKLDRNGRRIASPPGEPAFRRITLAALAHHGTLEHFFHKMPAPIYSHLPVLPGAAPALPPGAAAAGNAAPPPFSPVAANPANSHRYAVCSYGPFQNPGAPGTVRGAISGLKSFLNVWKSEPQPGGMTLSQQWIMCNVDGVGVQTIESGWQIIAGQSTEPTLFIFFNPDNYGGRSGYMLNRFGEGFVPDDHASWHGGGSFMQSSVSGGDQVAVLMVWNRVANQQDPDQSDWWLYMGYSEHDLAAVGRFPGRWYSEGLPAGASIASGADYAQFGGEVSPLEDPSSGQVTGTATGPMGSGVLPPSATIANLYGRVAFQSALGVVRSGGNGDTISVPVGDLRTNFMNYDPTVYDIKYGTDPGWGTYFFFGGPGAP